MVKTVTVRALEAFEYEGKVIAAGRPVTMPANVALAHARMKHVSLDRAYNAQAVDPEPEPEIETPRRRRTYRRRDMTAEKS